MYLTEVNKKSPRTRSLTPSGGRAISLVEHVRMNALSIAFLASIFCVSLPLGANREWAWSLLEAVVFLILAFWIVGYLRGRSTLSPAFQDARRVVLCLILVVVWQVFQIFPLPMSLLQYLAPEAYHYYIDLPQSEHFEYGFISLDRYASWQSILLTLNYSCVFALTLLLFRERYQIKILLYVLFYAGLMQSVLAGLFILASIDAQPGHTIEYATGSFVNRNHLAGFLELTLAAGIGILVTQISSEPSKTWQQKIRAFIGTLLGEKARVRVLLVIMIITLVLTRSRMGNAAFFLAFLSVSSLFLFVSYRRRHDRGHHLVGALVLLASMLFVDLLIVGNWFGFEEIANRVRETNISQESRADVFADASDMAKVFWATGVGGGAFASSFMTYQSSDYLEIYDHVHNDYLEFIIELGLPVSLLLSVVVFYSLFCSIKTITGSNSRFNRGIAYTSLLGCISLLIHSTVDFNLHIPSNATYFVILLALGIISNKTSVGDKSISDEVIP